MYWPNVNVYASSAAICHVKIDSWCWCCCFLLQETVRTEGIRCDSVASPRKSLVRLISHAKLDVLQDLCLDSFYKSALRQNEDTCEQKSSFHSILSNEADHT